MKIISKILDAYYTNKLIDYIKFVLNDFLIDVRTIKYKYLVVIKVKKPKYNDIQYKEIYRFSKEDAFTLMCMYKDVTTEILENINKYREKEYKWKK